MVVAIIGILAVIGMTQLTQFKDRAHCAEVKSDLGNLAAHQESYLGDNNVYLAVTQTPGGGSNLPNFKWTPGVTLVSSSGGATNWKAAAAHANCASSPILWDSSAGGLQ